MKIIAKTSGLIRNFIRIVAIAGCLSNTLHAAVAWQQEYTGSQMVDSVSSPWQNLYTAGITPVPWSVVGTTMKWSAVTPVASYNFARIGLKSGGPASTWIDSSSGTVEFSLKIDSTPVDGVATSFVTNIVSGGKVWTIGIDQKTIKLGGLSVYDANLPAIYTDSAFDGSQFNLFRLVFEGGVAKLYLNGNQTAILSFGGDSSATAASLTFGDTGAVAQGAATLEFVRWTSGAFAPIPEMAMQGYATVTLAFIGVSYLRRRNRAAQ